MKLKENNYVNLFYVGFSVDNSYALIIKSKFYFSKVHSSPKLITGK